MNFSSMNRYTALLSDHLKVKPYQTLVHLKQVCVMRFCSLVASTVPTKDNSESIKDKEDSEPAKYGEDTKLTKAEINPRKTEFETRYTIFFSLYWSPSEKSKSKAKEFLKKKTKEAFGIPTYQISTASLAEGDYVC